MHLDKNSKEVAERAIKEMTPNKKNMLFLRKDGKIYENSQVNSAFKRICKNAGIKVIMTKHKKDSKIKGIHYVNQKTSDVNVHMLRHTFATRCIENGVSPVVLQRILGHKDIQVTLNTYTSVFHEFKEKEIEKI